tara:strand:+ start:159 stop:1337 length:1179 start_codon:yes stop_codon:yes gene_type:complete
MHSKHYLFIFLSLIALWDFPFSVNAQNTYDTIVKSVERQIYLTPFYSKGQSYAATINNEDTLWKPIGFWTEYTKELSHIHAQYYYPDDSLGPRYINQWTFPDRKQILFNGEGFYYRIKKSHQYNLVDSIVYEVHDSLKNGLYEHWTIEKSPSNTTIKICFKKGYYYNNLPYGQEVTYYPNGDVFQIREYIDGKIHGFFIEFHPNKSIQRIGYYRHGEKSGEWKYYSENGLLSKKENYKNGSLHGGFETYFPLSGILKTKGQYKTREISFKVTYNNSNEVKIKNEKVDSKEGTWYYYNKTGNIEKEHNYINDTLSGSYIEYYPNGKIKVQGLYKQKEGLQVINQWDPGTLGMCNKSLPYFLSKKHGIWKFYNQAGELLKVEKYHFGELKADEE